MMYVTWLLCNNCTFIQQLSSDNTVMIEKFDSVNVSSVYTYHHMDGFDHS